MTFDVIITNPTFGFERFARKIEKQVNEDKEILKKTEEIQADFCQKVKTIIDNPEKKAIAGALIARLMSEMPRFSYIKSLNYNGEEYVAEIDHLECKIFLNH